MAPKVLLNNVPDGSDLDKDTKARFGTAIGSLIYLMLIGYTDADFSGSVVTNSIYSTSGYVFKLTGALVSWSSKRQGEVATSTTHAEYIG
ncbi:uncharacterized protein N7496_005711 [Penicillium cataractarum]|uniref:Uncharacterized protein n=1 Tax=Penicillium cataractarum TaxID=2100454 RepID=A0A9W9SHK7_9EURO|nr:uncharacterized protein N7496_005711 [Penicillium cataractarum]KAJ5378302.1 hypothetical protein N7496_005711 [Penicillium cataractarum]